MPRMPLVWTDAQRLHDPKAGIWIGVRRPADELPARATAIRDAVEGAGSRVVEAEPYPDDDLLAVHTPELVAFLRRAWDGWEAAGLPDDPGQDLVVGYIFPHPGFLGGVVPREPTATWARTGFHAFDTMTGIGPGTWEAARAAVDVALTAADLVLAGAPAAYACCRPPGHHVTRSTYGGSCYLNNSAVAAQHLRTGGASRVAVLDVDAHHGNGAQAIFWERGDVLTASVHVDPGAGWFPHFVGFDDERGAGAGEGRNLNVPVAPGSGDEPWLAAIDRLVNAARAHRPEALVVALGVDAAAGDPNSPLEVSAAGLREAGRRLGALGLPTVLAQEGGYDLATIGGLVLAFLDGFEAGVP